MRSSNNPLDILLESLQRYKTIGKLLGIAALGLALLVCWNAGVAHETEQKRYAGIPKTEEAFEKNFSYLALTDLDRRTDAEQAKVIDLSDFTGAVYVIREGGDYRLTGSLDGSVHVVAKEQNVHLFLDNVNIVSADGPAIYCQEADKLMITLLPDTENIISDSGYYGDPELESCIESVCDMTFNGSGSLTVNGFYKDAVRSRDIIKVMDGSYTVKCKRTAFHGNDGIFVSGGDFSISTEKTAFRTAKSGGDGRGNLMVTGCTMRVIAGKYSFVTEKADLFVYDCRIEHRSIVGLSKVGGRERVQEGCVA